VFVVAVVVEAIVVVVGATGAGGVLEGGAVVSGVLLPREPAVVAPELGSTIRLDWSMAAKA